MRGLCQALQGPFGATVWAQERGDVKLSPLRRRSRGGRSDLHPNSLPEGEGVKQPYLTDCNFLPCLSCHSIVFTAAFNYNALTRVSVRLACATGKGLQ